MTKLPLTGLLMTTLLASGAFAAEPASPAPEGKAGAMHERMGERMNNADTNGDGAIDKAEFLKLAETRFAKMDANSDGKITPEERKAMHEKHGMMRPR